MVLFSARDQIAGMSRGRLRKILSTDQGVSDGVDENQDEYNTPRVDEGIGHVSCEMDAISSHRIPNMYRTFFFSFSNLDVLDIPHDLGINYDLSLAPSY